MTESDILNLIRSDNWMMSVLNAAEKLNLPQWVIGAGFVRNKVWNHLSGHEEVKHSTDIDLAYFDPLDPNEAAEKEHEKNLREMLEADWSVKNQARMHLVNGNDPYISTEDALAHWPETATSVGVTMEKGELKLVVPYVIGDLIEMVARPCPKFKEGIDGVKKRALKKGWLETWPKLRIEP